MAELARINEHSTKIAKSGEPNRNLSIFFLSEARSHLSPSRWTAEVNKQHTLDSTLDSPFHPESEYQLHPTKTIMSFFDSRGSSDPSSG